MIDERSTAPYAPVQAVVVYKKDSNYYLETHDILQKDGEYAWLEGKPFAKEQLGQLATVLGNEAFEPMQVRGLFPDNVLYFQQTFTAINLVWYLPPAKRQLHFKGGLKLASTTYHMPGLIFAVRNKSLCVYAIKGNKRPDAKTKVFKGPFHNTSGDGNVCLGTAGDGKQKKFLQDEMARWEKRFFASNFTHGGDGNLAKGFNINLVLKAAQTKPFNENALALSRFKSVEGIIKNVTGKSNIFE
jgi:PRTRC genetic system protein B